MRGDLNARPERVGERRAGVRGRYGFYTRTASAYSTAARSVLIAAS